MARKTDIIDLTKLKPNSGNSPLVSVIVPSYNVEEYIDQCLTSILNNGYQNIELLVIDDRSTDGTVDRIKALMKKDERIQLFHNPEEHNIYGGACRNIGLDHAKGKYVYFCDSDDYILPGLIPECMQKCERLNAEICCFKYKKYDVQSGITQDVSSSLGLNRLSDKTKAVYNRNEIDDILSMMFPNVWSKFYKREFLLSINARFQETRNSNDVSFFVNTTINASRITYIDKCLYVYRWGTKTSVQNNRIRSNDTDCIMQAFRNSWKYVERVGDRKLVEQFSNWVMKHFYWNRPRSDNKRLRDFCLKLEQFFNDIGCFSPEIQKQICQYSDKSSDAWRKYVHYQLGQLERECDKFNKISEIEFGKIKSLVDDIGVDNITTFIFDEASAIKQFNSRLEYIAARLPFMVKKPEPRPIKTIAIYYHAISKRGGIQTYIETSIKMFKNMQYNVVLVTTTPKEQLKIDVSDVKVEVINCFVKGWNESIEKIRAYEGELKSILTRNRVDLFYTQDHYHWITLFDLITANQCNCFTILHFHSNPLCKKRNGSPIWKLQYSVMKYFDYCISLSTDAERFFGEIGVYNKYIPNIIPDKLNQLMDESPVKSKETDILWVGRLCQEKGIKRIIWVLKNIKSMLNEKITVKIIGIWANDFGSYEKYMEEKGKFLADVDTLKNSGKFDITIHEEYNPDKIYEIMQKSKVMLYTSKYDGYPYAIVESLANGLPVVAYSQPEIELFKNEKCVSQFIDSGYGAMQIANILSMSNEEYLKKQMECKKFLRGIYHTGRIEDSWRQVLTHEIYRTGYASHPESTLFKMILNNI